MREIMKYIENATVPLYIRVTLKLQNLGALKEKNENKVFPDCSVPLGS
jgi:hypothetical protein